MSTLSSIPVGSRVITGTVASSWKSGYVRFVGETKFSAGEWIGIELDSAEGLNDGSVNDVKYFDCKDSHGLFVKRSQCRLEPGSGASSSASQRVASADDTTVFHGMSLKEVETDGGLGVEAETSEDIWKFWKTFETLVSSCREILSTVSLADGGVGGGSGEDALSAAKKMISEIQEFATNSNHFLVAYDIKRSQADIEKLGLEVKDIEARCLPKKKFSFKSRATAKPPKEASVEKSVEPVRQEMAVTPITGSRTFVGCEGEELLLVAPEISSESQVLFQRCVGCAYSVLTCVGSVRLEGISHCRIFLGPCMTSVYLEDCRSCVIFASCHQLRIHNSSDTDLYVRVNSHPIIEDCSDLRFAPYVLEYPGLLEDFKTSGLEHASSWDNVVDFKWHRSSRSPNWSVLDHDKFITTEGLPASGASVMTVGRVPLWACRGSHSASHLAKNRQAEAAVEAKKEDHDEDEL